MHIACSRCHRPSSLRGKKDSEVCADEEISWEHLLSPGLVIAAVAVLLAAAAAVAVVAWVSLLLVLSAAVVLAMPVIITTTKYN